jgi:hypothetical protein
LLRGQPLECESIYVGTYSRRELGERKLLAPGTIQADIIEATNTIMVNNEVMSSGNSGNTPAAATTCDCDLSALETQISEVETRLSSDISDIDTDVRDLTLEVGWNWGNITEIKSNLPSSGNTDNSGLAGRVSTLEGLVADNTAAITALDTSLQTANSNTGNGDLTALEGTVAANTAAIEALDGRVEALETA